MSDEPNTHRYLAPKLDASDFGNDPRVIQLRVSGKEKPRFRHISKASIRDRATARLG
jgi:hypothetical protein